MVRKTLGRTKPVSLMDIGTIAAKYLKAEGKNQTDILNDLWHALVNFDSEDKLAEWLVSNFQIE